MESYNWSSYPCSISPKRSVSQRAWGERGSLRRSNIADLEKRLAAIDGQGLDVVLLVRPVHEVKAETAHVRMVAENW